jgi:KTSC domain
MARAPSKKISEVKRQGQPGNKKVHAGTYVHDAAYDIDRHRCGPWIEVGSSRVDAIRYDYENNAVQVLWAGKARERGYIYLDVPYERFRSFVRAASKGKYINSAMNAYEYRQMTPEELDAPSDPSYSRMGN